MPNDQGSKTCCLWDPSPPKLLKLGSIQQFKQILVSFHWKRKDSSHAFHSYLEKKISYESASSPIIFIPFNEIIKNKLRIAYAHLGIDGTRKRAKGDLYGVPSWLNHVQWSRGKAPTDLAAGGQPVARVRRRRAGESLLVVLRRGSPECSEERRLCLADAMRKEKSHF
jgi:hypothetical protein